MTMHWIEETRRPDGHADCQWHLRSRCLGLVPVEAESITAEGEGLCSEWAANGQQWIPNWQPVVLFLICDICFCSSCIQWWWTWPRRSWRSMG